jgi:SLOG in TRPM, prokaryote
VFGSGGMVLDGGTASGVMAMVGAALRFTPPKTVRVVGVVPAALVSTPDQDPPPPDSTPLESHHSNFMMVPSKEVCGVAIAVSSQCSKR